MSGKSRNRPASADRGQEGWRTAVLHFAKGRSLGDCAADGRDNILLLRLLAALMVVFGHCVLAGPGTRVYAMLRELVPQIQTHVVGLMMFFTISGFLITLSFERHPELLRFLRARALRLWPALIVCVLAWAFVLGPMLTALPLREYAAWHRPDNPYAYAWDNASLFRVRMLLPGLFEHNRIPLVVNSSLWTIPVEATMYLWVAGAGTLRLLRFPWLTSFAIAAVFGVLVLWPMSAGQFHYMSDLKLTVQGFFGAGAIACLLRRHGALAGFVRGHDAGQRAGERLHLLAVKLALRLAVQRVLILLWRLAPPLLRLGGDAVGIRAGGGEEAARKLRIRALERGIGAEHARGVVLLLQVQRHGVLARRSGQQATTQIIEARSGVFFGRNERHGRHGCS